MKKLLTIFAASIAFVFGLSLAPLTASACGASGEKGCGCTAGEKGDCASCEHKGGECPCAQAKQSDKAPKAFSAKPAVGTKATCPVMGGEFTVTKDTQLSKHKGKYYAFCCPGCKPQFDKNPAKYLK